MKTSSPPSSDFLRPHRQASGLRRRTFAAALSFGLLTGSALAAINAGDLVISEFRVRGPSGANDEFVEIYNTTTLPITVATSDASPGYALAASDGVARFVIPNGTVIPAHGHYLGANSVAYSLGGSATANTTWTTDIPDNAGIALFKSSTTLTIANRLDAVGSTSEANVLYKEGAGYPALTPFSIDYSFYRFNLQPPATPAIADPFIVATDGEPKDTDDNAADFVFVDTNGTSAGAGQRLGAPGPENLASPISNQLAPTDIGRTLIDPGAASSLAPNRVRDFTSSPATNSTFGILEFSRSFQNNTGAPLTALRFRIVKLTTFPAPSGFSDLRPITSPDGNVLTTGGNVAVKGAVLNQPPSQPNGGGFNSTFSVPSVSPGTPLAPGASVNVRIRFGIQQTGTYRLGLLLEGLPGAAQLWYLQGDTDIPAASVEDFPGEIAAFTGPSLPANERTDNVGTQNFGAIVVGGSSAAQTFTIKNTGSSPLSGIGVTSTNAAEFTLNTVGTAASLAPGAETTFTVTFSPSASGARNGVINIASNDPDENPFRINVAGTGATSINAGDLVISEFRLRGPSGANDEFVEIYNTTLFPITVQTTDASPGYALVASDGIARMVIPNGTIIPAHGHYLGVNSVAYSLASYPAGNGTTATGNVTWTTDIPDNAGIALFKSSTTFNNANRLDAVGSTSEANALYKEGTGYPALTPFSINSSFYRFNLQPPATPDIADPSIVATDGEPKDTDNNAADFVFVDTNGTSAGAGQRLGAPGPENLSSPISGYSSIPANLARSRVDPGVAFSASPNRVRDNTSDPANNSTFGTLAFNRVFRNDTGAPLTRLRFRIIKLTTFPAGSGTSDLRPRTAADAVVATSGGNVALTGTTLEDPPSQPNGGGWNSSLSVSNITLGTPLAAGDSVNLRFLFGIQQAGAYRIALIAEGLPGVSHLWYLSGNTENPTSSVEDFDSEITVFTGAPLPANERIDNAGTQDFGNVSIGDSSAPQTFTIKNDGGSTLSGIAITSTNAAEFAVDTTGTAASLPPNGTTTFTVTFSPNGPGARSGVVNIASNDSDENPFRINVGGIAINTDLAVTLGAAPLIAPQNTDVTYTLGLTNNGPVDAVNPVVNFPLPADLTFVSATSPGGWTAVTPAVGSGGVVNFSRAAFANGASANFTVVAKVKNTTPNGTIVVATVTTGADGVDLNPVNNSASVNVAVGTPDPTVVQIGTTGAFNQQTGMFEVTATVTNTTPFAINGFRLNVDFSAYLAAHPSLRLYNATANTGTGTAYVDHPHPAAIDQVTSVTLVFYTSTRLFPDPFLPGLTAVSLPTSQVTDTNGSGVQPRLVTLPDSTRLIEFPSITGHWYRVRYSANMVDWQDCPVPIQAGSNRMQWIDSGPPFTESPPSSVPQRFYIVNEIPAP